MTQPRRTEDLDRNLALELVRVTEAAAMAAGRWVGRGDKEGGDGAAVDAMRKLINSVSMSGIVVIGEGEKDNAPMLFNGEHVGDGTGPEVDDAGARIRFISDGDIAGAISAAREGSEVDVLMGIGGTPEGITAACALKCMGGAIQAKLWPRDESEREKALAGGHDLDRVLTTDDLVTGDNCFFVATGVTTGDLLKGVRYRSGGAHTQSIVMRSKSGTIRVIDSYHRLEKLSLYSSVDFDGALPADGAIIT